MRSTRFLSPALIALGVTLAFGAFSVALADNASSTPSTASSTPTLTLGNVRANVDTIHATIRWNTNIPADSTVNYGTTTSSGNTVNDNNLVTQHGLLLYGIMPGTLYHFMVTSSDGTQTASSPDNTFTLATSSSGTGTSTVVASITNVRAASTTPTSTLIKWHTNQAADSQVQFGADTNYGTNVNDSSSVNDHSVALTGLTANTTYHYRVLSNNSNGQATSADYSFTTSAVTPVTTISGITVSNISTSTASISWMTNQAASSQVFYGTDTSYGSSSTLDPTATTSHMVMLSGLAADTTYHFQLQSNNSNGLATSSDQSFMTTANSSGGGGGTGTTTPATMISSISVSNISTTSASVSWTTDQAADSQVFYGTNSTYGSSSTLDTSTTTSHMVMLMGLSANTLYHFQVASDNSNGLATSSDQTFMTTSTGGGGGSGTSTPLALLGIDTVRGVATPNGTFDSGFEWVFHFVVPWLETQFAMQFSDFTGSAGTIPAANNIRYYSTEADASTSASAITITAANTYPTTMLNLTGDADNDSSNGRQVDVVVETAVPSGTPAGTYSANWAAESASTTATTTP